MNIDPNRPVVHHLVVDPFFQLEGVDNNRVREIQQGIRGAMNGLARVPRQVTVPALSSHVPAANASGILSSAANWAKGLNHGKTLVLGILTLLAHIIDFVNPKRVATKESIQSAIRHYKSDYVYLQRGVVALRKNIDANVKNMNSSDPHIAWEATKIVLHQLELLSQVEKRLEHTHNMMKERLGKEATKLENPDDQAAVQQEVLAAVEEFDKNFAAVKKEIASTTKPTTTLLNKAYWGVVSKHYEADFVNANPRVVHLFDKHLAKAEKREAAALQKPVTKPEKPEQQEAVALQKPIAKPQDKAEEQEIAALKKQIEELRAAELGEK